MIAAEPEDERQRRLSKGPCFGQRHVLVLLANLAIMVMYCMRINLSVALVAMVNATAVEDRSGANETISYCPVPSNSSRDPDDGGYGGTFVWSRQLQGLILSSFFWGYIILQIPASFLSLRFGGKRVLLAGVLWTAGFTALTPLMARAGPHWLIVFRFLEGIGEGVTYPSIQSMLGRWIPREEATFLVTVTFSGSTIGTIIGQLVSGPLCQSAWGWPSAFYASAVAGLVWCLPWVIFVSDSPENNGAITNAEALYIAMQVDRNSREKDSRRAPWRHILTDPAVWATVIALTAFNWTFYVMISCLPQYLSDVLQFDIATNGFYSSLPYIISLPFTLVPGYLFNLVVQNNYLSALNTRKSLNLIGFFGIAACLFGITRAPCDVLVSVFLLGTTMCLIGIISVATTPNLMELSAEFSGSLLALANTCGTMGGILAPYVTDFLTPTGTIEEWSHVFYVGMAVSIFGAIVFTVFASADRRKWSSTDMNRPLISDVEHSINFDG